MEINSLMRYTLPGYAIILELASHDEYTETTMRVFSGMDEREVAYMTRLLSLLDSGEDILQEFLDNNEAPSSLWQEGVTHIPGQSEREFKLNRLGIGIDNFVAYRR